MTNDKIWNLKNNCCGKRAYEISYKQHHNMRKRMGEPVNSGEPSLRTKERGSVDNKSTE